MTYLTREIAHSAAIDAANRSMRKGGRRRWSREDYREYVRVFNELWPEEFDMHLTVER